MGPDPRSAKGFTLIELLIVVSIVGILALAAVPVLSESARNARRSEGESMLGMFRTQARAVFAETGSTPDFLTGEIGSGGSGIDPARLTGTYNRIFVQINSGMLMPGREAEIYSQSPPGGGPGVQYGVMGFDWVSGRSEVEWYTSGP